MAIETESLVNRVPPGGTQYESGNFTFTYRPIY